MTKHGKTERKMKMGRRKYREYLYVCLQSPQRVANFVYTSGKVLGLFAPFVSFFGKESGRRWPAPSTL